MNPLESIGNIGDDMSEFTRRFNILTGPEFFEQWRSLIVERSLPILAGSALVGIGVAFVLSGTKAARTASDLVSAGAGVARKVVAKV